MDQGAVSFCLCICMEVLIGFIPFDHSSCVHLSVCREGEWALRPKQATILREEMDSPDPARMLRSLVGGMLSWQTWWLPLTSRCGQCESPASRGWRHLFDCDFEWWAERAGFCCCFNSAGEYAWKKWWWMAGEWLLAPLSFCFPGVCELCECFFLSSLYIYLD